MAAALAGLVLVAGCGGGPEDDGQEGVKDTPSQSASGSAGPQEAPTPLVAHDPPLKFAPAGMWALDTRRLAAATLDGKNAYGYAQDHGELVVADLASGEAVGDGAGPKGDLPEDYGEDTLEKEPPLCERTRPGAGTAGGKRVAVGVFPTVSKGSGTTADTSVYELVTVDAATGTAVLQAPLGIAVGGDFCQVSGVSDTTAVLVLGGSQDGTPTTYGVDLATGRVSWDRPGFEGQLVLGGRVVGRDSAGGSVRVTSLDAATGKEQWQALERSGAQYRITAFSPEAARVRNVDANGSDEVVRLSDGVPLEIEGFGERLHEIQDCVHDQRATTICSARTTKGGELSGYDAVSGTRLWTVGGPSDTEGRSAPELLTAFHGAVYGRVVRDGRPADPIVLDARTGKDRESQPGAAPFQVNEYAAFTAQGVYETAG
ncbi:PQQ-binding-like beta-propeller repeat protein [Streptomyces sp. NPDC006512]|uniref:outer membrane protein assembly factor BamB family protein n=1 Tax=Streptomyces sp. NPDC006512 TaxID=3154307 RepID=UPI0033B83BDA